MDKSLITSGIEADMASLMGPMETEKIRWILSDSGLPEKLDYALSAPHSVTMLLGLNDQDGNQVASVIVSVHRQDGNVVGVDYELANGQTSDLRAQTIPRGDPDQLSSVRALMPCRF